MEEVGGSSSGSDDSPDQMPMNVLHDPRKAIHNGFGCDVCKSFPIKGSRHRCIVCDDYDLCEKCYRSTKSIHHHPFYKIEAEDTDPYLLENPLENAPILDEKVKQNINNLFKLLCMEDQNYYEDINAEKVLQAEEGLSVLDHLFKEVQMNEVNMDKIAALIRMLSEEEIPLLINEAKQQIATTPDKIPEIINTVIRMLSEKKIPLLINETKQQFATILGKISEVIIRKTITMRKCFKTFEENKLCECGHDKDTHNEWAKEKHIEHTATSVVGNICFKNTAEDINMGMLQLIRNKKYFRIDSHTSKESLSQVINLNWLESTNRYPSLLISLIGDTKHMKKDDELIKNLKNGLIHAALLTDAVIVTNGLHTGIAKLVGEAVQEVFYDPKVKQIKGIEDGHEPLIVGVTSWASVRDKENLISKNGEASYDITSRQNSVNNSEYLDCFHNRFILVDEAGGNSEETASFRLTFERLLVTERNMFVVVIGGDEKATLKQIIRYWERGIPTYIVPKSGGLADTLLRLRDNPGNKIHEMLLKIDMQQFSPDVCKTLENDSSKMLFYTFEPNTPGAMEKIIFQLLREDEDHNTDLLINFAFDNTTRKPQSFGNIIITGCSGDTVGERWKFIEFVLKSKKIKDRMFRNTKDLNKFRGMLPNAAFTDGSMRSSTWLQNIAPKNYKNTEYFKLLSELTEDVYKKKIDSFMAARPIVDLNIPESAESESLAIEESVESDAEDADSESDDWSSENGNGDDEDEDSKSDEQNSDNGNVDEDQWEQLLIDFFLWSLLLNKLDLAKLICRISRDVLANCIVGFGMLKNLARRTDNTNLKSLYEINAREFSKIAVEMLDFYQKVNCKRAEEILHAKVLTWGDHTYLDIAMKMKNEDFTDMLDKQWMGKLNVKIGTFKCLLCIFCPPLIWCMELFEKHKEHDHTDHHEHHHDKCFLISSVINFYSAPFIVYIHNVISYLVFLQVFSYTILTQMKDDVSWIEMLLMVWVFSILCDEIRQLLTTSTQSTALKEKCIEYISDFWNIIDMVSILLFVAAVVCRYFKLEESLEASRVLYACSLMTFYLRILHMFSINKKMGPTLRMIAGMMDNFALFMGIILILVISYGVASYSIAYPNSEFNFDVPWQISRSGFWPVFGNFFLDETEAQEPTCSFNATIYASSMVDRCPTVTSRYVNPILLGFYYVITNVLLLNFIISVFSNAMADVAQKSKQKWQEDRCFFIYTYLKSPILAPPFILLSHIKEILFQIKRIFTPDKDAVNSMNQDWKVFSKCKGWKKSKAYQMLLPSNRMNEVDESEKTLTRNLKSMKVDINNMDKNMKTLRREVQKMIDKQNEEFQKKFREILEEMKRRQPTDQ